MVSSAVYIIFPVLLAIGLLRKWREYQWGHCNTKGSLHGKVFLVTGANSGIGKETVRELARRKAKVIMACRDLNSARSTVKEIRENISSGELIPIELDLALLASIRAFVKVILNDFPKIHVLINNAGVYVPVEDNKRTVDNFEINFGVNHLGHFLLTNLLIPQLKNSAPSRVVVVSSQLHEQGVIDFDNLNAEKGFQTMKTRFNPGYCNSKLANMYFTKELAKRTKDTGIEVCALCPGFTYTGIFRYSSNSFKWYTYIMFAPIAFFFMRTATQGAQTVLQCATAPTVDSGGLYKDCVPYKSKVTFDPEISAKLWEKSAEMVKLRTDEVM